MDNKLIEVKEAAESASTKVFGVYFCQDCKAGNTCHHYENNLVNLYSKREDAQKRLDDWAKEQNGPVYKDSDSVTVYFDVCTCECDDWPETCDYKAYLKAGDWAGLQKMYVEEHEVIG